MSISQGQRFCLDASASLGLMDWRCRPRSRSDLSIAISEAPSSPEQPGNNHHSWVEQAEGIPGSGLQCSDTLGNHSCHPVMQWEYLQWWIVIISCTPSFFSPPRSLSFILILSFSQSHAFSFTLHCFICHRFVTFPVSSHPLPLRLDFNMLTRQVLTVCLAGTEGSPLRWKPVLTASKRRYLMKIFNFYKTVSYRCCSAVQRFHLTGSGYMYTSLF